MHDGADGAGRAAGFWLTGVCHIFDMKDFLGEGKMKRVSGHPITGYLGGRRPNKPQVIPTYNNDCAWKSPNR